MNNCLLSFLLNEWLWSITWALYHAPIALVIMAYLFFRWEGLTLVRSVGLSLAANIFSSVLFIMGIGTLVWFLTKNITPQELLQCNHSMGFAALSLAAIYVILQGIFFGLIHNKLSFHWGRAIVVSIASNVIAAFLIYKLLPAV